jgi:hypothetical protein
MNEAFNITVKSANRRGLGSLLWEIIGVGFNKSKFDLTVSITDSLYTNNPEENMWDNYFEPINNSYKIDYGVEISNYSYDLGVFYNMESKKNWNRFYRDRILFKNYIMEEFFSFYEQYFVNNKVIGVHYRSTDIYKEFIKLKKVSEKYNKASVEMYFNEIDKLDYDYIYLATDSNQIFNQFKEK